MKRQFRYLTGLIGVALTASSCGASGPPSVLPFSGSYNEANIVITIMMPDEDFFEYNIQCHETEASIDGTNDLNADDACASLSRSLVAERLIGGRKTGGLCSSRDPQDGQLQLIGYLGEEFVNTFIDRTDGCGQSEWDELLQYVALPPSAAVDA